MEFFNKSLMLAFFLGLTITSSTNVNASKRHWWDQEDANNSENSDNDDYRHNDRKKLARYQLASYQDNQNNGLDQEDEDFKRAIALSEAEEKERKREQAEAFAEIEKRKRDQEEAKKAQAEDEAEEAELQRILALSAAMAEKEAQEKAQAKAKQEQKEDDDLKKTLELSEKEAQEKKADQEALQKVVLESQRSLLKKIAKNNDIDDITELTTRFRICLKSDYKTLDLSNLELTNIDLIFAPLPEEKQQNAFSLNLARNHFTDFFFKPEIASVRRIDLSDNKNLVKIFFNQDIKKVLSHEDKPLINFTKTYLFHEDNAHRLENVLVIKQLKARGYNIAFDQEECVVCLEDSESGKLDCCGAPICQTCNQAEQDRSPDCATCRKPRGALIINNLPPVALEGEQ